MVKDGGRPDRVVERCGENRREDKLLARTLYVSVFFCVSYHCGRHTVNLAQTGTAATPGAKNPVPVAEEAHLRHSRATAVEVNKRSTREYGNIGYCNTQIQELIKAVGLCGREMEAGSLCLHLETQHNTFHSSATPTASSS